MAKAILKLGEYLNFIMEINDVALEVFHDKKNMLWGDIEFLIFLSRTILYLSNIFRQGFHKIKNGFPPSESKTPTKLKLYLLCML